MVKSHIRCWLVGAVLVTIISLKLAGLPSTLLASLGFGLAFGGVMQRSRFCFTASLRDPFLTGSTSLTRAVVVALLVSTPGFFIQQYRAATAGLPIPGIIEPAGFHTALGALIFGTGMVIAGGCAAGVLVRMGEGHLMQWVTFLGLLAGSLQGARDAGWWDRVLVSRASAVFLPNVLGWPLALGIQTAVLALAYLILSWYERARFPDRIPLPARRARTAYQVVFKDPWAYWGGGCPPGGPERPLAPRRRFSVAHYHVLCRAVGANLAGTGWSLGGLVLLFIQPKA